MRVSTSFVYDQQTADIDRLVAQQTLEGQQLSTGLSLTQPSDDPGAIAQLLQVQTDIGVQTQVGSNLSNVNSDLTTVDGALNSVTSIMQQARTLAIQAASDTNTPTQLQEIAIQVNQLLQETVGLANTQYAGRYVFAGTANPTTNPVTLDSSSPNAVDFSGNIDQPGMQLPDGQTVTTGVTLQQAFNYDAANNSPSVFQVLQNLYNTLTSGTVNDTSSTQVNTVGSSIIATTTLTQLASTPGGYSAIPLTFDGTGTVSISIATASAPSGTTFTFTPGETISQVVNQINTVVPPIGVTASFDYQTEKMTLSGTAPFTVNDVPPGGGGNFVEAFQLQTQAATVNDISRQLGDFDNATQVLLDSRAVVGSTIQQVQSLTTQSSTQVNDDTTVQSNLQDTDVAKTTTQLQLTQTALEAAYATTTRLEQKDLFDYLS